MRKAKPTCEQCGIKPQVSFWKPMCSSQCAIDSVEIKPEEMVRKNPKYSFNGFYLDDRTVPRASSAAEQILKSLSKSMGWEYEERNRRTQVRLTKNGHALDVYLTGEGFINFWTEFGDSELHKGASGLAERMDQK